MNLVEVIEFTPHRFQFNWDIPLDTFQETVQVSVNDTKGNQNMKVSGVLKTFLITLIIHITFKICNFILHREKLGQSWEKFHFFQFQQHKKK